MSDSQLRRADVERLLDTTFIQSVHFFPELGSTNDEAQGCVGDDSRLPALFVAARQTAGRGRGSNRWIASAGALTFSLLADASRLRSGQEARPQLSLWTALGIRSGLARFVPASDLQVKWPNDVYLRQKKVCGILIESVVGAPHCLVVGIGINANNMLADTSTGEELSRTAIALREVCGNVQLVDVLHETLLGVAGAWSSFAERHDICASWRPHCFLTGKSIQWQTGASTYAGVCGGIAPDGALLLKAARELGAPQHQDGTSTIRCYGGTVSF